MAWQSTMGEMLRILIHDLDSTPTYTDERLESILLVSAQYVKQEMDFSVTYTINITNKTLSPDPTTSSPVDDVYTNFVVLKGACIADQGTFRTKALAAGIQARCGPAVINTMGHLTGFKQLLEEGPCAAYKELKIAYEFGDQVIKAVLSPFVSNNFDPHSLLSIRQNREW